MQYYIYALVNPRDDKPFYIGKGKGNRAWWHVAEIKRKGTTGCRVKDNHIKKLLKLGIEPIVKILNENLDEATAYKIENELIKSIGCIITKTGPLTNVVVDHCIMTNKGRKVSAETRAKISIALKGKKGRSAWNKGKTGYKLHSEEYKERLRKELSIPLSERLGEQRAAEMIDKVRQQLKDKTHKEIYGDKSDSLREQISLSMKGKSLEEIIGDERAKAGRISRSENYHLTNTQFKKGLVPWNKGKRTKSPEQKHTERMEYQRKRRLAQK